MATVLIVDDHEVVRAGLRALLQSAEDFEVVAEASTAAAAIERVRETCPDSVILDVHLPDGSGIAACRDIKQLCPPTAVMMFTGVADDADLTAAMLAGASAYLVKEIHGEVLLESLRRVSAGESLLDAALMAAVRNRRSRAEDERGDRLSRLTPTENRILTMIAHGLTNRAIGDALGFTEKTIKNYVSTLMSKLEVSRRAGAAAYWAEHRVTDRAPDRGSEHLTTV